MAVSTANDEKKKALNLAIDREGARPDERGQLAGGPAASEVHLEETVLCVEESGRPGDIDPVRSLDRRNAEGIARDAHGRR